MAALTCFPIFYHKFFSHFDENVIDKSAIDIIDEISIGIDDVLVACSFAGKRSECNDLFRNFSSNHGICFTFNSLRLDDILRR